MIAHSFVRWCETARVPERCSAVEFLADVLLNRSRPLNELEQAEAMLILALDDPSPKVRLAIAERVKASGRIPREIVRALAGDVNSVACVVAAHSPQLTDSDLVELAVCSGPRVQLAVAGRRFVSERVSSQLAVQGSGEVCLALIDNPGSVLSEETLEQVARRFADDAQIRAALLDRPDLTPGLRHALVLSLAQALGDAPFVRASLGDERAARIVFEAGEEATSQIIAAVPSERMPRFAEDLRAGGHLSVATLVRATCAGNIDFFAAALVSLGRCSPKRVRAILVDGREAAFAALMRACGLPEETTPLFVSAVQIWKEMSASGVLCEPAEVAASVIDRVVMNFRACGDEDGFSKLETYLQRLSTRTGRAGSRAAAERRLAA